MTSYALDWWTIAATLAESLAGGSKGLLFAWVAMILAACALLSGDIYRRFRSHTTQQAPSLSLFCLLATTVAGAAGLFFFRLHGMFPKTWHYLPFIGFLAIMIDASITSAPRAWKSWATMIFSSVIVVVSLPEVWTAAHSRRSNLDVVCRTVASKAGPKDLVLVNPFWLSPGVNYYYRGSARGTLCRSLPMNQIRDYVPIFRSNA